MLLAEAFALFRRLAVNVEIMNRRDFSIGYFALAKRYHPDRNPRSAQLMANIKCSESGDLEILSKFSALASRTLRQAVWDIREVGYSLEQMARSLVESGEYRVTSRLEPQAEYHPPDNIPNAAARTW